MYASSVDGQKLTFAVSGLLWQRSLVMIDLETKSLWGQLLGEAMEGKLKGKQLESIPSVMTDWRTWSRDHPTTTVLDMKRTAKAFVRSMYANPQRWVVGIIEDGIPRAWPMDQLRQQGIVNDQVSDIPIVLMFNKTSAATQAYRRDLDGQTLRFVAREERIVDQQTGSTWNPSSGKAVDGPLKDKQLKPVVTILSFRKPWKFFHPESSYWQAK